MTDPRLHGDDRSGAADSVIDVRGAMIGAK